MSGGILRSVLVFLLENHFVRFVVTLLMSCAYDTYSYGKDSLRNYIIKTRKGKMFWLDFLNLFLALFRINSLKPARKENHEESVRSVQRQVREWRDQGMTKPMCTSRPSYKSITPAILSYKDRMHKVAFHYSWDSIIHDK